MTLSTQVLKIRRLGRTDYAQTWHAMQAFTSSRTPDAADELWLTEHAPVYTMGLNRKDVRLPDREDIPLILVDRGGKITYHGPGQVIAYLMLDLKRKGLTVRQLVSAMENAVIALLEDVGLRAQARADAPGVYVDGCKIASLGLRLKNQRSYHGLALNVDMDLAPFGAIDPCGYRGLKATQLRDLGVTLPSQQIADRLQQQLVHQLNYAEILTD